MDAPSGGICRAQDAIDRDYILYIIFFNAFRVRVLQCALILKRKLHPGHVGRDGGSGADDIGERGTGVTDYRFAARAEVLGDSIHDHAPGAIVLSSGLAYPKLLPGVVDEATLAAGRRTETMQYGPLMGIDDLREQIVRFLASDGIACSTKNVLVTNGAKHALDLACRVFVEPGDRIIVTDPTYMTALQIMRSHGVAFLAVPQDAEGLDTGWLESELRRLAANGERMPKLLFDVPDFHNPTGITMSLERRRQLVDLATRYGIVILEDDPYRRIRFEGPMVPPVKSLDETGAVVSLGTVSKILAPGLRLGWAVGAKPIVDRMAAQKAEGGSCPFTQRVVADLMRGNRLADHIAELTGQMRNHRDTMLEALRRELPEIRIRTPEGGYFLWAELPRAVTAAEFTRRAAQRGVEITDGRLSFAGFDPGHYVRLAYSFVDPDTIREAVGRLAMAYRQCQDQTN